MSKIIESLEESKSEALAYIVSQGIPRQDAEDVYQEVVIELISYYKDQEGSEEQASLYRLVVNSQVSKYYKDRGASSSHSSEVQIGQVAYTFDQLYTEQEAASRSPLALALEAEESKINYHSLIEDFTANDKHRELLGHVFRSGIPQGIAGDLVGLSKSRTSEVVSAFLSNVGG